MDSGAWWATVYGVAKSQTQLSDLTLTHNTHTHTLVLKYTPWVSKYSNLSSKYNNFVSFVFIFFLY